MTTKNCDCFWLEEVVRYGFFNSEGMNIRGSKRKRKKKRKRKRKKRRKTKRRRRGRITRKNNKEELDAYAFIWVLLVWMSLIWDSPKHNH